VARTEKDSVSLKKKYSVSQQGEYCGLEEMETKAVKSRVSGSYIPPSSLSTPSLLSFQEPLLGATTKYPSWPDKRLPGRQECEVTLLFLCLENNHQKLPSMIFQVLGVSESPYSINLSLPPPHKL
jgi:hypothetical protein